MEHTNNTNTNLIDHSGIFTQNQLRIFQEQILAYRMTLKFQIDSTTKVTENSYQPRPMVTVRQRAETPPRIRLNRNQHPWTRPTSPIVPPSFNAMATGSSVRVAKSRFNLQNPNKRIKPCTCCVEGMPMPPIAQLQHGKLYMNLQPTYYSTTTRSSYPTCSFCETYIDMPSGIFTPDSCQHIFCVSCAQNAIKRSNLPQIPCPSNLNTNTEGNIRKCNTFLLDPDIKSLVSNEVFEAYLSRSLTLALKGSQDLKHCLTTGCNGVCEIENGLTGFYCPFCSKLNCFNCKTTHANKSLCEPATLMKRHRLDNENSDKDEHAALPLIGMRGPNVDSQEDIERKNEWEESWVELCAKFKSGKSTSTNNINTCNNLRNTKSQSETKYDKSMTDSIGFGSEYFDFMKEDLMLAEKEFECSICFLHTEIGQGVILQECFHKFCRHCLSATIQHSEEPVIKCPFRSDNYTCQSRILDKEMKSLISPEMYDAYLDKSLNKAEMTIANAFHCKQVNCHGWAEVEPGVQIFICPICKKHNCVPCKAIHLELSCTEYKNRREDGECDWEIQTQINQGKAMRCPTCKVIIEKNSGCDGITCAICKTILCWPTKGRRWGRRGVGDTSGGCGCTPEKKCHPDCNYCH